MTDYIKTSNRHFNDEFSEYRVIKFSEDFIQIAPTNEFSKGMWTDKGLQNVYSIVNTGDGYVVNLNKRKITLDYSEAHDLFLLLRLMYKESKQGFDIFLTKYEKVD